MTDKLSIEYEFFATFCCSAVRPVHPLIGMGSMVLSSYVHCLSLYCFMVNSLQTQWTGSRRERRVRHEAATASDIMFLFTII